MAETPKKKVNIHYIKNNDFRTVLATGIYGGPTGSGLINVDFFTDRTTIARRAVYEVDENNGIKGEILSEREARDGMVREVHFGIVMDVNTAKIFANWLKRHIEALEQETKPGKK